VCRNLGRGGGFAHQTLVATGIRPMGNCPCAPARAVCRLLSACLQCLCWRPKVSANAI